MSSVKNLHASLWENPFSLLEVPETCRQMVLVVASGWTQKRAILRLLERQTTDWAQVPGAQWPVDIGERGMAVGRGLWTAEKVAGPRKVEGDRRTPAGLFALEEAFGYEPQPPDGCRLPYRQATSRDYYIDDPASPDYNRWVRIEEGPNAPERRWRSFERMRMSTDQYRMGIVVAHNRDPVVPGKGSCIFLHLWQAPGRGTAGCTAMADSTMREVLRWLDPSMSPLLLQVPQAAAAAREQL